MTLSGIFFVISIFFTVMGVGWLLLELASLGREWRTAARTRQRLVALLSLVPPVQMLTLFVPLIFAPELGFRSVWFLFGYLTFIGLVLGPYYLTRRWEQRRQERERREKHQNLPTPFEVRRAVTGLDFAEAGRIFAQVFGPTFDQIFGRDRQSNGRLLGELLQLKKGEVYVTTDGTGRIIGAMWLDIGDHEVHTPRFAQLWPILRRYLDPLNAMYGSIVGVPAMMAREGSEKIAYIHWLGVLPEAQGQGVGHRMLERAEEVARQNGRRELSLHTESSNRYARRLYRDFGMRETARLHLTPQVHFVKKVGPNTGVTDHESEVMQR
jgi:ribosomal protein S18 acetylase RimI-like enzyme